MRCGYHTLECTRERRFPILSIGQVMRTRESKVHDDVSRQASKHVVQTENFVCRNIFFCEASGDFVDKSLKHWRMTLHSLQGKDRGQCRSAWLMRSIFCCGKRCQRYVETILEKLQLAVWCRRSIDGFKILWIIDMDLEGVNADDGT